MDDDWEVPASRTPAPPTKSLEAMRATMREREKRLDARDQLAPLRRVREDVERALDLRW